MIKSCLEDDVLDSNIGRIVQCTVNAKKARLAGDRQIIVNGTVAYLSQLRK
jgi:hypothetical protein